MSEPLTIMAAFYKLTCCNDRQSYAHLCLWNSLFIRTITEGKKKKPPCQLTDFFPKPDAENSQDGAKTQTREALLVCKHSELVVADRSDPASPHERFG